MTVRHLMKGTGAITLICSLAIPAGAQAKGKSVAPVTPPVLDSLALQPQFRHSWTSDDIRFHVGDIVTLLIDENTTASANLTDNNSETKKKGLGLDVEPPPPALATTVALNFNQNGDSEKSGTVLRQNGFSAQMSVRVVAISPSGLLKVSGHKLVNVDKSQQDVTLSGWIRSEDISVATNAVSSSRLADAEINYVQKGSLGTPRVGIISKILGALWP
jgi:flagellar L-ring protein precursor FlgH